jgi:class 3 adenylate cyclase
LVPSSARRGGVPGRQPPRPRDRERPRTVLFTDIVGSTETAAKPSDRAWRDLVGRHDDIIRRQLTVHRGHEIKTLGDGFLATFDGPARVIRCATAIRDHLSPLNLPIRSGIHTAEVELTEDDVVGMAVNIGARIRALADPGEVRVSSTVKELVVGSGLDFVERGVFTLKGAPGGGGFLRSRRRSARGTSSPTEKSCCAALKSSAQPRPAGQHRRGLPTYRVDKTVAVGLSPALFDSTARLRVQHGDEGLLLGTKKVRPSEARPRSGRQAARD